MRRGFSLLELFIVLALLAIVAAIVIPNLQGARKHGNEAAAIGALKTIAAAQVQFRERRLAGGRHGDLRELSEAGLIDGVLGAGVKQGYEFAAGPCTRTPELLWFATARPVVPRTTGDRYFAMNQTGSIHYTCAGPLLVPQATCAVPTTALQVGR
jgi:prepilin-type N-terminal cleavage/methylation domain-containing protein